MTAFFKPCLLGLTTFILFALVVPAAANTDTSQTTMDTRSSDLLPASNHSISVKTSLPGDSPFIELEQIENSWQWADNRHDEIANRLDEWSNKMNDWFGEPDSNQPASASLRIILDTRWIDDPNAASNITVEPRVRGRLRLPVLEKRISIIFGDDDLDEETLLKQDALQKVYREENTNLDKVVDTQKIRDDNASIALRWSRLGKKMGLDTDVDIGLHSLDDLYLKVSANKDLYKAEKLVIRSDNFYRYGTDSEHYAKAALNFGYQIDTNKVINNRAILRYRNKDEDEHTIWSNELRQIYDFGNNKQLSYGLSAFGFFESDNPLLNSYGPAISYRQPIWREWLSVQTDFNYYNNKTENKDHHAAALLRLEALF